MTGLLCDASTQINPTSLFDVLLLSRPLGAFCISVWYHWIHFLGPLLLHCQPMGHVLVDSVDSLDCSGMRKMHRGYARVHANTHRPESNGYTCVFMPSRCSEVLYCMHCNDARAERLNLSFSLPHYLSAFHTFRVFVASLQIFYLPCALWQMNSWTI